VTLLAEPNDLQDLLGYPVPETQALLLLELASDVIRSYCGWRLDRAVETLTVHGEPSTGYPVTGRPAPTGHLLLPTLQLNAVLSVTVDGKPFLWWRLNSAGVLWTAYGWGHRVDVEADHGYDPVPGDIRAVVLSAATRMVVNPQGLRSVNLGNYAEVYTVPAAGEATNLTLTSAERRILDRHRIWP
jgi:hypothetical protein